MELYAQNGVLKNQIKSKRKELRLMKHPNDITETKLKYGNYNRNPENYDPIMNLTESFNSLNIEKDYTSHFGATSRLSIITKDPILAQIYSTNSEVSNISSRKNKTVLDPVYGPTVGFQLILHRINEIIPSVDHCNIIVKYYWLYFDSMWNVIDYEPFTTIFKNICSIITDDNGISRYRFEFLESQFKDSEIISLATFMVILRIGYLTMPIAYHKGNNSCLDQFFGPLIENNVSIGPEFMTLSLTLISFVNTKKTEYFSLLLLQYFLCVRFYRIFAPEDGDGDDAEESAILVGQTTRLAFEMGINRDPDIYDPTGEIFDECFKFKWRKTWSFVVAIDAMQASNLGRPLLLNEDYIDTKQIHQFHIHDSSFNKNIPSSSIAFNIRKLQNIAGMLNYLYDQSKYMANGASIWMNVKEKPRRSSVESIIVNLLESLKSRYPRLSKTFKNSSRISPELDFTSNINNKYINKPITNISLIDNDDFKMKVLSNAQTILRLKFECILFSQLHFHFYLLFLNSDLKIEPNMCQHYLLQAEISACLLFYCALGFYNLTYNNYNESNDFGMGVEARHLILPQIEKYVCRLVPFVISMILRSQTKEFQSQLRLCNLSKSSLFSPSITVMLDIFKDNKTNCGYTHIYSYLPNEVNECLKKPLIDYFQEYYEMLLQCPERFTQKCNDIYTVWNKMKSIYKKNDNGSGINIPDIPIPFNHEGEHSIDTSDNSISTDNENETLTENDNIIFNNTFNTPNEDSNLSYTQDAFKNQLWPFSIDELMDISELPDIGLYSDDLLYESLRYDSVMNDLLD